MTDPQAEARPAPQEARPVPRPVYSLNGDVPTVQWEMISPEQAHEALANMRKNRPMRNNRIEGIKRDILAGKWRLTGETVKQGLDGKWDDGQHRFTAIYRSGISVPMLVVRGITPEAAFAVDSGITRTFGDRLRIDGVPMHQIVSQIVRRMWWWDRKKQFMLSTRDSQPTNSELDAYRLAHEEEIRAAIGVAVHAKECYLTPTVLGTVAVILRRIDPDRADDFLLKLVQGAEMKFNHPVMQLRKRLKQDSDAKMQNYEQRRAMVFYVWNLVQDGRDEIESISRRTYTNRNYPLPH